MSFDQHQPVVPRVLHQPPPRLHQPPQQIPQVVDKNAEPRPHLIATKPVAAQPRRLHRLLALLDPFLCLAALVIEMDNLPVHNITIRDTPP